MASKDTIELRLKTHPQQDTVRVNLLNQFVWKLDTKNKDSLLREALHLADKLHYREGKAIALVSEAVWTASDYKTSISLAKIGLAEADQSGDTTTLFWAYKQVGFVMASRPEYGTDALPILQKGLQLAKAAHNLTFLANVTVNQSIYYSQNQLNYPLSVQWGVQAVQTASHSGDLQALAWAYQNLGTVYELVGDHQKAITTLNLALNADQRSGGKKRSSLLSTLGEEYSLAKQYQQSLQAYSEAIKLEKDPFTIATYEAGCADAFQQMGNDSLAYTYAFNALLHLRELTHIYPYVFSQNDHIISLVHLHKHQTDSALYYARQGYNYAMQLGFRVWDIERDNSEVLAEVYAVKNDYANAYKYYKIYTIAKDSVINQEKVTRSKQQQDAYDLVQQQSQIQVLNKTKQLQQAEATRQRYFLIAALVALVLIVAILFLLYRNNRQKQKANVLLQEQKSEIQHQRDQTNDALAELKATQAQLIQSEKMASLGELTAGIAHEIQNPLNFVNNFSDVNQELMAELKEEAVKGNMDEVIAIADDVIDNSEKINHHGKRADAIVKGMLQHSRQSKGVKELITDINALCDEYLRLSYHGLRAKDKTFNADFITDFDETIGKINIVPQDMGRVLLNLFNNAFYAVNEKKQSFGEGYKPLVRVQTKMLTDKIEIRVTDNGTGIPQKAIDKIFQPFFTTKPTGQGTGLGLSLSYDIVTKEHGGVMDVQSEEGKGTSFIIRIPFAGGAS